MTAYHGAAPLLTTASNLPTAAGILAVEAYHAGLIRTTINYLDPTATSIASYTNLISTLRVHRYRRRVCSVWQPARTTQTLTTLVWQTFQVSLGGGGNAICTRLTDADQTNVIAFARNTTQV